MFVVVTFAAALAAASGGPCATLAVRDLPPSAAATVGFGARPDVVDFADSAVHPVRVHRGAAATAAQAALVLAEVDAAWALQVDGAGFAPPLPDDDGSFDDDDGGDGRLDLYLDPLAAGIGAVTIAGGDGPRRPVFISIDPQQFDDVIAVAVHHEFQHALQFAVDAKETPMWFESNAVAWEVKGRPDIDVWRELLPSFQAQPQAPIFTDAFAFAPFAVRDAPTYEYGAAFFVLWLDEVHGDGDGRLLQRLWAGSAQAGDENEPDWLDAAAVELDAVPAVLADFAAVRVVAGDLYVDGGFLDVTEGANTVGARAVVIKDLRGVERLTTEGEGPFVGGCAMFKGAAPVDEDVPVAIRAVSDDGHALAPFVVVVGDDAADTVVGDPGVDVAAAAVVAAGRAVVMGVCDVSPADADSAPVFAPVRLTLSRTDREGEGEGEGEAAAEGEGEGEGKGVVDCGCGCDQLPPSSPEPPGSPNGMRRNIGVVGFFVGVFAFAVRAWRHLKRKRLYKKPNPG